MWLNITKEQIGRVIEALATDSLTHPENLSANNSLAGELAEKMASGFDPGNAAWVEKAFELYQRDGETEVDQQSDDSAMISISEDGGAYVMAWVWVSNADMGIAEPDDEDDGDEGTCRKCGEEYELYGDGYDGMCPICADKAEPADAD